MFEFRDNVAKMSKRKEWYRTLSEMELWFFMLPEFLTIAIGRHSS